jgi:hypothetical protein
MRIPAPLRSVQKYTPLVLYRRRLFTCFCYITIPHNNEIPGPFAGDSARMNCIILSHSHSESPTGVIACGNNFGVGDLQMSCPQRERM